MTYYPNGNIKTVCILHHNFKLQELGWYETGQIWCNHWWKDRRIDGHWQGWCENDQIWYKRWYNDKKSDGHQQGWYDSGQIEYDQWWKDGKLVR